jgi:adenosylcobyric acid synthase
VTVIALPRMSNHTDVDALASEPGVVVRFARHAAELGGADLVVLPGSRATVRDLAWLRERGIDQAIGRHVGAGLPVLGICGGYQMLGSLIDDDVESGPGRSKGSRCCRCALASAGTRCWPGRSADCRTEPPCTAKRSITAK